MTLVALVVTVMVVSAGMNHWLGQEGILITSAITGLVDAHAIVASMGSMVQAGQVSALQAQWPIVATLLSNMLAKSWVSWHAGTRAYCIKVVAGQMLVMSSIVLALAIANR